MKIKRGIVWKEIPNYEGMYSVSNNGEVKSLKRKGAVGSGGYRVVNERILKYRDTRGYKYVRLFKNGKSAHFQIHQLVAMSFLGHIPCKAKLVIDHKNFITSDNNSENLKIVTSRENTNRKHIKHTSQFTGVCWYKITKKWVAQIVINGKKKNLGYFHNEMDASYAYEKELQIITNKN